MTPFPPGAGCPVRSPTDSAPRGSPPAGKASGMGTHTAEGPASGRHRTIAAARAGAAVLVLALAGCGTDAGAGTQPRLTVSVRAQGADGPARAHEVRCERDATDRCERLTGLHPHDLAPVAADRACTMIYGGPATATVAGRLDGETVAAEFSLRNGCEIARWQRLSWLLGAPPNG